MTVRSVGLAGVAYHLPGTSRTLRELARDGLIAGEVTPLETFGFSNARIAREETHIDLAVRAARAVLEETDTDAADVDLVLYAGALASSSVAPARRPPRDRCCTWRRCRSCSAIPPRCSSRSST